MLIFSQEVLTKLFHCSGESSQLGRCTYAYSCCWVASSCAAAHIISACAGGLTEQSSEDREAEEAVVKRRLLIGGVLTVGTIALSLIPTEDLDGSANKPLYVYLVPLLRSIVRPFTFMSSRHVSVWSYIEHICFTLQNVPLCQSNIPMHLRIELS